MVAELLVDVAKLPHHFTVHVGDGVELVEGKEGLLVLADMHIDEAEVVDGLQAVSADADGLQVDLLGTLEFIIHEHAVALVHQRARIVAVRLHGNVRILLCVRMLRLKEVQEGQVGCRTRHQRRLLTLKLLENCDCLVKLLAPQEVGGLGNFQLGPDPRETVVVQRVDDPVIAGDWRLLHDWSDQVGSVDNETGCLTLPPLDVLPQRIIAFCKHACRVLAR
mmetsp:Transcript_54710/g.123126  ORF Transcript_54710/g.123126 Transcript_54710/m.123126 type:complete len:221 (+) Transcript_54710:895-1557(+)